MEEPWTILELAGLAADALAAAQPAGTRADAATPSAGAGTAADDRAPSADVGMRADAGVPSAGVAMPSGRARANGRVRDVPNERLVRWYVTVGLVDPPLSRRGRVARYGRRHLLQLVAVKRRQAEGRSLAEIQAELAGATDETLAEVARLQDTPPAPPPSPAPPDRFWARQPGPTAPDARRPGQAGPVAAGWPGRARAVAAEPLGRRDPVAAARRGAQAPGAPRDDEADRDAASPPAGLVYGIRLAPGVTLLLEGADREPGPEDLTDITDAAEPLLRELANRNLRVLGPGHPADVPGQSPGAGHLEEGAGHDH